jgi:hypothetical protein
LTTSNLTALSRKIAVPDRSFENIFEDRVFAISPQTHLPAAKPDEFF